MWAIGLALSALSAGTLAVGGQPVNPAPGAPSNPFARPWLGLAMDVDGPAPAAAGARVHHVVRGSPADHAGLRDGDHILRIATVRIVRGADVVQAVSKHIAGEAVEVAFVRGTVERTERVVLGTFPSQEAMMRMDLLGTFAPPWKDVAGISGAFPSALDTLRGHVVVIDFWATWCGPCRIMMPKLGALQARYGAQGLNVVGISAEEAEDVAAFAEHTRVPYPIGVDKRGETTRSYGVSSLPTIVVIDKRGTVRDLSVGYDPAEDAQLDGLIRSLLAEPAAAP